jgi:TonB family protein
MRNGLLTLLLQLTLASLVVGCASSTQIVLTEDNKAQLRQVKRIGVEVSGDVVSNEPPGADWIYDDLVKFARSKVQEAGFSVAGKDESIETRLRVWYNFVTFQPVGAPPPNYKKDTRYMRLEVRIEHKSLGQLSRYVDFVEPPYQYAEIDTFRWLDRNVLISLEKLDPSHPIKDSCTRKLERPDNARVSGGQALFKLDIAPDGAVTNAEVLRSTGDRSLDAAGIAWAMSCRYSPEFIDGIAASGSRTALQGVSFSSK